jgi:sugar phosphate isomerase/epimerase
MQAGRLRWQKAWSLKDAMKLSLAIQTPEELTRSPISLLSGSLDEMLAKAAGWGADGCELMPVDPTRLDAGSIRGSLERCHLEVGAVGTALLSIVAGLTLLNPEPEKASRARTQFYRTIDFAASIGAPLLTIGGFRGRFSSVGREGRQQFIEIIREAADYSVPKGVQLVLEPINRYQSDGITSTAGGLAFLEEVNHPGLGLLIDTCHMTMEESSWTEPFRLAMEAGRLWHIHLAENNRLTPGRGLIDFKEILKTLKEIGYDRHLTLEVMAIPDPDSAACEGIAYIRNLLMNN